VFFRRKIHNLLHPKLGKILMLHSISSPKDLESLVGTCRSEGFEPISLDEAVIRLLSGSKNRFSCFTFDDGYKDTYTISLPTLIRLNVPFCVYMTRDFYRGFSKPAWAPSSPMMTVEQMMDMGQHPLCTIGVHTCSHPHLSRLGKMEQKREIANCKSDLESILGKRIFHLAYPHGDYNHDTLEIVSELGFVTAVTTSGRHVRDDSKLLELDRIFVNEQ